jgi:2-polyprenyl-6-methoxyphenol hydroxylase-like FAD-dependent oxidoreductase
MPPDVGQGVSCAAEDSVAYALFLKHFLLDSQSGDEEIDIPLVLRRTAEAYELVRKPRIHRILDQAKYNASSKKEMNFFSAWMRDFAMWTLCKSPRYL